MPRTSSTPKKAHLAPCTTPCPGRRNSLAAGRESKRRTGRSTVQAGEVKVPSTRPQPMRYSFVKSTYRLKRSKHKTHTCTQTRCQELSPETRSPGKWQSMNGWITNLHPCCCSTRTRLNNMQRPVLRLARRQRKSPTPSSVGQANNFNSSHALAGRIREKQATTPPKKIKALQNHISTHAAARRPCTHVLLANASATCCPFGTSAMLISPNR
jgi:hypothetical protein